MRAPRTTSLCACCGAWRGHGYLDAACSCGAPLLHVALTMVLLQLNGKMEIERENEGPTYDVFARLLRGLAGARLSKPGKFRTADGVGYALRCSYKVT